MYQSMMGAIREETVSTLFSLDLSKQRTQNSKIQLKIPAQPKFLQYSAPTESGKAEVRTEPAPEPDNDAIDIENK